MRRLHLAILPLLLGAPLHAQSAGTDYPAIADVDPVTALSRYLRMLAANPRDLASLTGAGRAALAVGDANAALGFYARAEEIAPRNGRIKAGLASALVQMEQPRAALKLFADAVALGVPEADVAADRGLAHDLNGDGRHAQADYTLALRTRDDDETLRRLALSMAISGDKAGALTMLDPLLRRGDGGAIRARAFVLALTGDQAAAATAVRGALPGPQASVMTSFMSRLGRLNPAQKALAVNFGYFPSDGRSYSAAELFVEQRRDPAAVAPISRETALAARNAGRADAPLIPAGAALGPRTAATSLPDADARAPRRRPGLAERLAAVEPPPHVLAAPIPGMTPAARYPGAVAATAPVSPGVGLAARAPAASTPATAPAAGVAPSATARPLASSSSLAVGAAPAFGVSTSGLPASPVMTTPQPAETNRPVGVAPAVAGVPAYAATMLAPGSPMASAGGAALGLNAAPPTITPSAAPSIATVDLPASTPPVPAVVTPPAVVAPARPASVAPALRLTERSAAPAKPPVAAKPVKAAPKPIRLADATPPAEDGRANTDRGRAGDAAGRNGKAGTGKPGARADSRTKPDQADKPDAGTRSAAADKAGKGKAATTGKAAAKDKADATGKSATKGKADSRDKAGVTAKPNVRDKAGTRTATRDAGTPDIKAAARASLPERYWVQVASGSNKANLDKAWSDVKGKAPKLLNGRATYTAPWRASNRLLVGPFKTEEEAQAQVNKLAKAGVSGIQFTTRAGADVEKVGGR